MPSKNFTQNHSLIICVPDGARHISTPPSCPWASALCLRSAGGSRTHPNDGPACARAARLPNESPKGRAAGRAGKMTKNGDRKGWLLLVLRRFFFLRQNHVKNCELIYVRAYHVLQKSWRPPLARLKNVAEAAALLHELHGGTPPKRFRRILIRIFYTNCSEVPPKHFCE